MNSKIGFRKDKTKENTEPKPFEKITSVKILGKVCGDREIKLRPVSYDEEFCPAISETNYPTIISICAAKSHFLCLSGSFFFFN